MHATLAVNLSRQSTWLKVLGRDAPCTFVGGLSPAPWAS